MPVHVPLLFHLNQHLNEYSLTASRACYKGLLRVLRSHPTIPVNIHISGTLVHALQWLDPEPLQLIWEGLRAGQFELLGSTYAQNVPYSSDDWDNAHQVELHLKVLHDAFGVTPVTFWNPERTWRQSLLPIIAGNGYRFTMIEDHILAKARLAEPVVVTSQVGAHILTLLYDDHLLRNLFNFAVWFGRPRQLQMYLSKRADHPNVGAHCLTYAEDASAMGLWGWQNGVVPNQSWHRLDQLLTLLEALPEVELIHLTNAPASAGNLSPIPDGNAMWMDRELESGAVLESEQRYHDWFEFNNESETLSQFRVFFGEIRGELREFSKRIEGEKRVGRTRAAQQVYEAALHNFLGHQYEFGCVGVGQEGYWGWAGAEATRPLLRIAELALTPETLVSEERLTTGEQDEVVLSDGRSIIVTTAAGGRLLYWFDGSTGKQYVGNQRAVGLAKYESDASLPERVMISYADKLPDDVRPQALVPGARLIAETAPTRMGKYLPEWIWEDERGPFELLINETGATPDHRSLPVQRRGFTDYIQINGQEPEDAGAWLETTVETGRVCFRRVASSGVELHKSFALKDGEIHIHYLWINGSKNDAEISWCALTELSPDYASVMAKGRKALQITKDPDKVVVRNSTSKEEVHLVAEPLPVDVHHHEGLLALEVSHRFELEVPAETQQEVTIRLLRTNARQRDKSEA